jgi:hypothetical protein
MPRSQPFFSQGVSELDSWPSDHTIVFYLCVADEVRPVATARNSGDVPGLLRHLANVWEIYGSLPVPGSLDDDVYFADL